MKVIRFRNNNQVILFNKFVTPAIVTATGMWRYSRPYYSWSSYTDVIAAVDPKKVGRNFDVQKRHYNLTTKDFIEKNSVEMITTIHLAGDTNYDLKKLKKDLKDMKDIMSIDIRACVPSSNYADNLAENNNYNLPEVS